MGRRFFALSILVVIAAAAVPHQVVSADDGVGCKLSCHDGIRRGRNREVITEESETTTTTTGSEESGKKNRDRKKGPELKCTRKNNGVISIKANWARRGTGTKQCVTGELNVDSCSGQFMGVRREKPAECPERRVTGEESGTSTTTIRRRRYTEICDTFEITPNSFARRTASGAPRNSTWKPVSISPQFRSIPGLIRPPLSAMIPLSASRNCPLAADLPH